MIAGNGWFAEGEDNQKLRDFLFPDGVNNPYALGKSPQWIGEQAGVAIPENAQSIVMEITQLGQNEPVSKEKLFPVLGFYIMEGGVDVAIENTMTMLNMMGKGHSAVVHSTDPAVIVKYSRALPVWRVAVNTPGILGSAGFFGGSSVPENIGPKHLVQYTRIAYDADPSIEMGDVEAALAV